MLSNDLLLNSREAGDEPYMLASNLKNVSVLVDKDRVKSGLYAIENFKTDVLILDDGFQHRKLHRDLDIVLADSEKLFGNENLLPAGPLREMPDFDRVDKFIIIKIPSIYLRGFLL